MSTFGSTSNLNDILNDLNDGELEELCENYCGSNSDTEGTNEFLACQLLNLLQCYGQRFMNLVLLHSNIKCISIIICNINVIYT